MYLFPAIVLAIPLFVLFSRLGLRGSLSGLALVYVAQTVPVSIYMLRNYFDTVPRSLEEAAAVDGMAGSVILTVPIVVLFFATERLLTEGLTGGAEKG